MKVEWQLFLPHHFRRSSDSPRENFRVCHSQKYFIELHCGVAQKIVIKCIWMDLIPIKSGSVGTTGSPRSQIEPIQELTRLQLSQALLGSSIASYSMTWIPLKPQYRIDCSETLLLEEMEGKRASLWQTSRVANLEISKNSAVWLVALWQY